MSVSEIAIYSLIGLGFLLCIISWIYVKFIKPNNFGYSSNSFSIKSQYKKIFEYLNSKSKCKYYQTIRIKNDEKEILLERIYITVQAVFVISLPLEAKVNEIKINNDNYKVISKNGELDLPIDVSFNLNNVKTLRKVTKNKNIYFIVPFLNKNCFEKKNNFVYFTYFDEIKNTINEIESQESDFDFNQFLEYIEKNSIKQNKRFFKSIFSIFKSNDQNN